MDEQKIKESVRMFLSAIGEDPEREGLLETPDRVAKLVKEVFAGVGSNPREHLLRTFTENHEEMVLVSNIPLYSFCEHHLLPFFGKAHVAYIPDGKITGLSKIARVVDCFSRRLQVQERLTMEIRDCIQKALAPMGVAVVIEAQHLCMMMRGVQKQNSVTTTSAFTGIFLKDHRTREEFIHLIGEKLH